MEMTDLHQHLESYKPATLPELLRWRALHQPDRQAYSFLVDGEDSTIDITYAELDRKAQAIAGQLQQTTAPGERIVLLYPPGIEYIAAFFGCLYAGAIAVPAYPPTLNRSRARIRGIVADAQPTTVLATSQVFTNLSQQLDELPGPAALRWLATNDLPDDAASAWTPPTLSPATIAFLQYTSGSTSTPKGVMLTHRNVLENARRIERCFEHTAASRGVIWLPPYHDMGLIGGIIQPLYTGFPVTLMSPVAFLQRPIRWLQAISRFKATTSGGPNFAYELCAGRVTPEQMAALDLSSWDVAFVGAEPIQAQTLERFAAVCAPGGFRPAAFYPCYGLAEATLMVTGGHKAAPPLIQTFQAEALQQHQLAVESDAPQARRLVGCGQSIAGQQIAIVDAQTGQRCQPGKIGEIWVSGPSVAPGYWNRPADTAQIFYATIAGADAGPFLRTGDLGCIHNGELFVTGRLKDLIIIRGQNYYPQDIERTVERSHPALRPNAGAAFSIEVDGQARLVVVQEVERQARGVSADALVDTIRQSVMEQHDLQVFSVALIKTGQMPKTSSGKIQRIACREAFLAGTLNLVALDTLPTAPVASVVAMLSRETLDALAPKERQSVLEASLHSQIAQVLGVDPAQISTTRAISSFGLDSLMAVQLQHTIEAALGVELPMTSFLRDTTIAQLTRLLLDAIASEPSAAPLPAAETTSLLHPLSYGQRALWFVHQLDPDSTAYTIAHAVRIRSELDSVALQRALERLVARHTVLRTTFAQHEGEPMQQVHEQLPPAFAIEPLPGDSVALHERLVSEAQRPFDLDRGPLLRVCLLSSSAQEHVLLLAIHHIIADLWSLSLLLHELGRIYAAEASGQVAALIPLTLQYTDYVIFQAELLVSATGTRLREYWLHQLADAPLVLDLPTDYPRPAIQTYNGADVPLKLSPTLTYQLKALAQRGDATLYMLLLAAFQVLLFRYTGQHDLVVGSPTSGRSRRAFAELVGYLVNPVVLRANLAHNPPFTAVLDQVRQTVLAALDHQDYPLPLLVEQLQPARDASRSPLFQVMFVFQRAHLHADAGLTMLAAGAEAHPIELGGLAAEPLPLSQQAAQFDLTLTLAESQNALVGAWQYNTDLFKPETIDRMSTHFQTLLSQIVAQPEQRIANLPLLTSAEQQALTRWNATEIADFQGQCLHHLLDTQAARTPDAIAVVADRSVGTPQQLTYRELSRRANQVAHYLRSRGVQAEVPIGICLPRSLELMIGLIGVLKAGGAYVPLDPAYPSERLRWMIADSRVPIVLTEQRMLPVLSDCPVQLICLDADWPQIDGEPADDLRVELAPDNLAYIIYTSGSTGRPKGAMNTHAGICNRLLWMQQEYRLSATDHVLQKTPFSFDVSVWEFFWPLITGARLVLAQPGGHLDPAYLIDAINRQQITTLHFVPSMLHVFVDQPNVDTCTGIRRIICSGEALPLDLQERCLAQLDVELHNLYGPTEAAVDVTFWRCIPCADRRSVPIGSPVANTQIYLLDTQMQPVPIGVAGELHIGGVQLARGYLHRPDLTAEKFIPDPFGAAYPQGAGARLYKTGDLARFWADGTIEFLGRIDHQVKLRGFRIELGEIETTLREHPGVRDAVVVAREERGDTRLVAYVVGEQRNKGTKEQTETTPPPRLSQPRQKPAEVWGRGPGGEGLREFLQSRLPDYMVPSAFVLLDVLPLLPNGKLDRRALPEPDSSRVAEQPYAAPRSAIEQSLADIWSELLGVQPIGIHDNFFALGGHSLLMTRVVARIRDLFNVDVSMPGFFQGPTIAELAVMVESQPAPPAAPPDRVMVPVPAPTATPDAATLERLLGQIERLSPDEIRTLLAARQHVHSIDGQPASSAQPTPTPVGAVSGAARYRSAALSLVSVGGGLELVHTGSGAPRLIDSELATLLGHCREFKTLDEHAQAIAADQEPGEERELLEARLAELHRAGLLLSDRETLERLIAAPAPESPAVQIAAVAWPTRNRAALLERSLASYIENCRRYGRSPEYVVMDDSPDVETQRDYQRRLAVLRDRYDVPILYAGPAEKAEFIKQLCGAGDLPPEVVEFAIFGDPRAAHKYGANTNAALLHTVGDPIICTDDDTIGRVVAAPNPQDGVRLMSGCSLDGTIRLDAGDPDEVWTFPSREALLHEITFTETDLLAIHERLLGHDVRSYAAGSAQAGAMIDIQEVTPGLLEQLETRGGQVLVTLPGLVGDCSWGTPSHYLSFSGDSLRRLVRDEQTYRAACVSRNLLRVARQTTISSQIAHLISSCFGLDNRRLVPPIVPIVAGQDAVFGRTISACYDRGYIAHLPWAILHLPGETRSFWPGEILRSASGISFQGLLSALIGMFEPGAGSAGSVDRLRQLGSYLEAIGGAPQAEFESIIRVAVGREAGMYLRMLEEHLQSDEPPPYWTHDVQQFSTALRQSLIKESSYIPLDLLYGRDSDTARRLTQEFVQRIGHLYRWWPEIAARARSLRAQGIRLATRI